jgi:hypothetical protein
MRTFETSCGFLSVDGPQLAIRTGPFLFQECRIHHTSWRRAVKRGTVRPLRAIAAAMLVLTLVGTSTSASANPLFWLLFRGAAVRAGTTAAVEGVAANTARAAIGSSARAVVGNVTRGTAAGIAERSAPAIVGPVINGSRVESASTSVSHFWLTLAPGIHSAVTGDEKEVDERSSASQLYFWNGQHWIDMPDFCMEPSNGPFKFDGFLWKCGS